MISQVFPKAARKFLDTLLVVRIIHNGGVFRRRLEMIKRFVIVLSIVIAVLAVCSETAFARTYSPVHGRFLQRDPVGYPEEAMVVQPGLYTYVRNCPTRFVDPYGRQAKLPDCSKKPDPKLEGKCCLVDDFRAELHNVFRPNSGQPWQAEQEYGCAHVVGFVVKMKADPSADKRCCEVVQMIRGVMKHYEDGKRVDASTPSGLPAGQALSKNVYKCDGQNPGATIRVDLSRQPNLLFTFDAPGIYPIAGSFLPARYSLEFQTAVIDVCRNKIIVAGPRGWRIRGSIGTRAPDISKVYADELHSGLDAPQTPWPPIIPKVEMGRPIRKWRMVPKR
jgi:hypothetical protein